MYCILRVLTVYSQPCKATALCVSLRDTSTHTHTQLGGAGDRTRNLPALPPEPHAALDEPVVVVGGGRRIYSRRTQSCYVTSGRHNMVLFPRHVTPGRAVGEVTEKKQQHSSLSSSKKWRSEEKQRVISSERGYHFVSTVGLQRLSGRRINVSVCVSVLFVAALRGKKT